MMLHPRPSSLAQSKTEFLNYPQTIMTDLPIIRIRGARQHNLANIDVDIPRNQLTVITGVSGSGKSSLAFDTLYAEGYRKYLESLSARSRMLLSRLSRPDVDYVEGLTPVIAIAQQTSAGGDPRATIATVTEIADYARILWAGAGQPFCPLDGAPVRRQTIDDCVDRVFSIPSGSRLILLAPLIEAPPAVLREEIERLRLKGWTRVRIGGQLREIDDPKLIPRQKEALKLEVVIDRIVLRSDQRSRIADSLEMAFREGERRAIVMYQETRDSKFRDISLGLNFSCTECATVYPEPSARLLNHARPEGACPTCRGTGEARRFDPDLIIPDPSLSLRNGAIKPWRLGGKAMIIRRNAILRQLSEQVPFDPRMPWKDLPIDIRDLILHGDPSREFAFKLKSGRSAPVQMPFGGVIADLEDSVANTSSDGFRARLMTFQNTTICPDCNGERLSPYARSIRLRDQPITRFFSSTISDALAFARSLDPLVDPSLAPWRDAISGLQARLGFLVEVGLDYLGLDRPFNTLSGGEAQRVRLATQAGTGLAGVTYVLDEPSIGLHPRDVHRLNGTLARLRDRGSTVVVVEHDATTMSAADHLIELGPGAGEHGGEVLFVGTVDQACRNPRSLSGPFLSGERRIEHPAAAAHPERGFLTIRNAREHNLRGIDARLALGCLNVVCGVSGSGKSTLVHDILAKAAGGQLNRAKSIPGLHDRIDGLDAFESLILVDQKPIGRSPRSNPATFTKLFDALRTAFASAPLAKVRGYGPSRFSFNVSGGRCENCRGDGVLSLEMEFLADATIPCPSCGGARYNRETLEVRYRGKNIAEVLEMTVEQAAAFFGKNPRIHRILDTLNAVGLGYLRLGQPATQLSGGEAQRLKLSLELSKRQNGGNLYILDEPTTGLHWIDTERLLEVLFRLRDAGNTIVLIEHDLDCIRLADWIVELGPEGGEGGGQLLFEGPVGDWLRLPDPTPTLDAFRNPIPKTCSQQASRSR